MAKRKRKIRDGTEILRRVYIGSNAAKEALLEEARANMEIARKIYDLREQAGLTQRELATKIDTTASVICRLEDADYQGHSLAMLNRIAAALGKRIKIDFIPLRARRSA